MKVIFFGTPTFASETLRHLIENHVKVIAIVTRPDKPKGRSGSPIPSPVKILAKEYNLPIYQPEHSSSPEFVQMLRNLNADLYVVVAYGEILKDEVLEIPQKGCINVHASLLPKYRGAAPIQQAIINGEKESGVTIMHMVRKMDAGDIIKKVAVPITQNMNFGMLEQELCLAGKKALIETIQDFEKGTPQRIPQDHSQATYAPKIELEDCQIDWNRPASDIHNLVRGVNPYPGAWCYVKVRDQKKRFKILATEIETSNVGSPSEILDYGKHDFIIGCGKQSLKILRLQLEGKKAMPAEEFMKGILHSNINFKDL